MVTGRRSPVATKNTEFNIDSIQWPKLPTIEKSKPTVPGDRSVGLQSNGTNGLRDDSRRKNQKTTKTD